MKPPIRMASVQALFAAEDAKRTFQADRQWLNLTSQMPLNTKALIRLLALDPDGLPFATKWWINLSFHGMVNSDHDTDNPVTVRVPSLKTWGQKDYIQEMIAPYWKGSEEDKTLHARPYYHRPSYMYPCFVESLPFNEWDPPENPIRKVTFTKMIQDQIRTALADPDLEFAPWDVTRGRDFRVVKAQQGSWPSYTQSAFVFRERALTDANLAAIEKYGIPDMLKELGEPPTEAVQALIKTMYHASIEGAPFDNKLWGHEFRAWGSKYDAATTPRGGNTNGTANGHDKEQSKEQDREQEELIAKLRERMPSSRTTEESDPTDAPDAPAE